ncbi:phospholipase D-like domain-containing protein [Undibacterium danionis]|uniref:phospholipase D n=1 Tax=Undibacterium danionis TaxID=1812100 RepID=A0ABV6IJ51_9BURK
MASSDFQVSGKNAKALFTLKLHRGDGMCLIAMNWKVGKPPDNFVGFAIESRAPGTDAFFPLNNRLSFENAGSGGSKLQLSTLISPIQKFRWIHFPRNANLLGEFTYRVTPVFMDEDDRLSQGTPQEANIELRRETYQGQLNVTFTRGFVSSQAFVDRFEKFGEIQTLIPSKAKEGLTFKATHPKREEALAWMGFEARETILELLDQAILEGAEVRVVAYDLSEPEVVGRLVKLKKKLRIIIDDSKEHGEDDSGETQSAERLLKSAGAANVKRQHMKSLQHNKMIIVNGPKTKKVVFGSTNLSWRGFYIQANNALVIEGKKPVTLALAAFDNYYDKEATFQDTDSAEMMDLGLKNIDAKVAFSPHSKSNSLLQAIGEDISSTTSSLFYSLAFLSITPGIIKETIRDVSARAGIFVYGIADKKVGGIDLQMPNGNIAPVFSSALDKNIPLPFSKEPTGGGGNRMHHKFVVIDFDKPSARVYLGSYNFSSPADQKNGENLVVIRDRRVAVSYTVEALRLFDHYHFRVAQKEAKQAKKILQLRKPPRQIGEKPWFEQSYSDPRKIRDRELFA